MAYIHGALAGRLFTGVALCQSPVEGVGKRVLAEVGQELLINLEGGKVGCSESSQYKAFFSSHLMPTRGQYGTYEKQQ